MQNISTRYRILQMPLLHRIRSLRILNPSDAHTSSRKEINGLKERSTWTTVKKSSLPRNAKIAGERFVNALKNVGTNKEYAKARFVGPGFNDRMKPFIVYNTPTLRQTSIIVSSSVILGFNISLLEITQAYLQSKDELTRDVFI